MIPRRSTSMDAVASGSATIRSAESSIVSTGTPPEEEGDAAGGGAPSLSFDRRARAWRPSTPPGAARGHRGARVRRRRSAGHGRDARFTGAWLEEGGQMKFGLNFTPVYPSEMAALARRAEEVGFESLWIGEHVIVPFRSEERR